MDFITADSVSNARQTHRRIFPGYGHGRLRISYLVNTNGKTSTASVKALGVTINSAAIFCSSQERGKPQLSVS